MSNQSRIESQLQAILNKESSDIKPQSRIEEILQSIIDNTDYDKDPQSRVEDLVLQIKEQGGGGSGGVPTGGTTGQVLAKKSDADRDLEWKTVEGIGIVDTEMSDTSENAVQNKIIKSYIDDKTLSPTGWGVAKAGRLTFTFTSQSQEKIDTTIYISELGLMNANDYEVQLTITGGGTMDWGAGEIYSYEKTTTRVSVTYRNTYSSTKDYAIADYVIIAKGYGGASDAQWGHISGTLTSQTDLVNYINENGGKIDTIKVNNETQEIYNKTVDIDVVDLGWESDKTKIMNKGGLTPAVEIKDVTDGVEFMFGKGSEEHKTFVYKTLVDKEYVDNKVEVFKIIKDTTTYQEVLDAFNDKKGLLFCNSAVVDATSNPVIYSFKQTDNILLYVHNHPQVIDVWKVNTDNTYEKTREFVLAENQAIKDYVNSKVGDLATLTTTDKTDAVAAINELKFDIDGLGEPFKIKQWATTFNPTITIPNVSSDIDNTAIPSFDFRISGQEAIDFQVVGMLGYEVFDESSKRINCFPVCQFTGEGQKLLRVRMMCGGTTDKVAKKISAWVLLMRRQSN